MKKKPQLLTAEDLLMNEGFLSWYYGTDQEQSKLWNEWIESNEVHRQLAESAIYRLGLIRLMEENGLKEWQINNLYDRIIKLSEGRKNKSKNNKNA
jgi:hypothetical protein